MFTAIMKVEQNRVAKYMEFATQADALAHVDTFAENYSDAFVVDADSIDAPMAYWWVEGEVVTVVQPKPVVNQNITTAPDTLFGGPTIAEVLGETS